MPRVVVFSTDPDLTADDLARQTAEWSGAPLELVWVSLSRVDGTTPWEPADDGWPGMASGSVAGWSVGATEPKTSGAKTTLSRAQLEAIAVEQGRRLWAAVEDHRGLAALVAGADALAAVDQGGVRTAYRLARRHGIVIATYGVVPCLVELAARDTSVSAQ